MIVHVKNSMLVLIDESGDSGFNVESSKFIALAMVLFKNKADAKFIDELISALKKRIGKKGEFKFSKCKKTIRDEFFKLFKTRNFEIRAVIVSKKYFNKIVKYLPLKYTKSQSIYYFCLNVLLDSYPLNEAEILLDKQTNAKLREFIKEQRRTFNEQKPNMIKNYGMKDSQADNLIQLADMVVGAIARAFTSKTEKYRWMKMLNLKKHEIIKFL